MRIYFLTCTPAILKLNGLYAGGTDMFERHIEVDMQDKVLAEIVPGENLQPVNFFLDEELLKNPPAYMDVYLGGGETVIYIRRFESRDTRINVIYQTRFEENLVTLFSQGEVYLSVEGRDYSLTALGAKFREARAEEKRLAGFPVLAVSGGDGLVVISRTGSVIFSNEVVCAEFGQTLKVTMQFETCAAARAVCEYGYDGEKLTLVSSKTEETEEPDEKILHFAFFESVMTFGDFEKYLSPELLPKAGDLRGYLGGFTGVAVPTESFCTLHPDERAAGLIYPLKPNLYEIKYFAVELKDGKVDNVFPVGQ